MGNLIKSQISFSAKLNVFIINFAVFAILLGLLIISGKNENAIVILVLSIFLINTCLIYFFLNWILKRMIFRDYRLKNNKTAIDILNIISKDLKISINNIEENIYYTTYKQKYIFGTKQIKDVFFIIEGKRIFLNIQNRNDAVFICLDDDVEKRIEEILNENSTQLNISNK